MTHYLGIVDYLVIVLALLISAAIGVKFRISSNGQNKTKEYLMAGQNMSKLPVILSISVTMVSAISMLDTPAEVYRYGIQNIIVIISVPIGMALATYVFIPVFFQCGVSTVYEYLEMRFGKTTRYIVSITFIVQMIVYMASVLYAPVLALSAVTNLSIEFSIILFGTICAFYCAVGGLKGVMWTDVFQSILMLFTLIVLFVSTISDAGGIANIYDIASKGERLQIFNETFVLYRISYEWLFFIGFLSTLVSTFLAILVTGWNESVIPLDSKCLSPVTRLWKSKESIKSDKNYKLCSYDANSKDNDNP